MPIVGFNFDKLLVERKKGRVEKGGINVKTDLAIKEAKPHEVLIPDSKDEALKFTFEFSADYEPGVGNIKIQGHILYVDTKEETKKILDKWKKDKNLPKELMANVLNTALIRSNIKALTLSQDVNLPPHLRLPTVKPAPSKDQKSEDYIG